MSKDRSIREFLKMYDEGKFNSPDVQAQIEAGWYDWFCKDTSLANKTKKLVSKLKQIVNSPKIDQDKMYVFFKNNCPVFGSLYDDFRICSLETGDVIYTITPASGHNSDKGTATLWGKENNFHEAIIEGTWEDIKNYFNS